MSALGKLTTIAATEKLTLNLRSDVVAGLKAFGAYQAERYGGDAPSNRTILEALWDNYLRDDKEFARWLEKQAGKVDPKPAAKPASPTVSTPTSPISTGNGGFSSGSGLPLN